jgi:hypothetical protein
MFVVAFLAILTLCSLSWLYPLAPAPEMERDGESLGFRVYGFFMVRGFCKRLSDAHLHAPQHCFPEI